MKLIFIVVLMCLLGFVIGWIITKIIKHTINLYLLYKHRKDYASPYFSEGGGLVYDKKTKKLKTTGGKIKLPFE